MTRTDADIGAEEQQPEGGKTDGLEHDIGP